MATILGRKPGGSGGGGSPTGAAGGDLDGTYPNPTLAPGVGGLFDAYALLRDEKADNATAGDFSTGAWRTRDLTIEKFDTDGIVSLAANQFTLQEGTYWIVARAPALNVNNHRAKIRNITDTADAIVGSNAFSYPPGGVQTDSVVQGRITIAAAKVFELQHRCETSATRGYGYEFDFDIVQVFSEVAIWREA